MFKHSATLSDIFPHKFILTRTIVMKFETMFISVTYNITIFRKDYTVYIKKRATLNILMNICFVLQ